MYDHEKITDPACEKRTDHVTTVDKCPVLYQSDLQSEAAISTMGAEVMAMAHSCKKLLPSIDMVASLGDAGGLPNDSTIMYVPIHEYKARVFILAETLPPHSMPQSKHNGFVKRKSREESS